MEPGNEALYAGTIRQLSDRHEIWSCIVRYACGVDRLDEDLILSAFWSDAHDAHGHINGSPQHFLDNWIPTQIGREVSQHFVSNHFVDLDRDGADSETYFRSRSRPSISTAWNSWVEDTSTTSKNETANGGSPNDSCWWSGSAWRRRPPWKND
jgi:hypothetical protein